VREYLIDLNPTRAYLAAGYSGKNPSQSASLLLRNPKIVAAIDSAQAKAANQAGISVSRVLSECENSAFLDPIFLFNQNGTLKALEDIPESARRAIAGIDIEETFVGTGKDRVWKGYIKRIRLVSKEGMLTLIARHLGMFVDKTELTGKNGGPLEIEKVRNTLMAKLCKKGKD
jgi:phage terminase small subunit